MAPLSRLLSDLIGPPLSRWTEAAVAFVADWLTWKDLGMAIVFTLWCCNLVYLISGHILDAVGEILGGDATQKALQIIVTATSLPLLVWGALALSQSEKAWGWNKRVFGGDPPERIVIKLSAEEWDEIMNGDPCGEVAEP